MAREISLQQTLTNAIEHQLENSHTAMPGIVVAVDLINQQLTVQPSLNIKMYDGSASIERPPITNVPLQFPSSKSSAFTFPVAPGDVVLLVFSERGLDAWKAGNGYPSTPVDFRMMDYNDAIAIPGIYSRSGAINNPATRVWKHDVQDTVVVHNIGQSTETEIRLPLAGGIVINTSQSVDVNCKDANINATNSASILTPDLDIDATNITIVGNVVHTGNFTNTGILSSDGVILNAHVHKNVNPGTGISGPPVV